MEINVAYGKGHLAINVPDNNLSGVYRKKKMPVKDNPEQTVREALSSPIGTNPLRDIAAGKKTACIVVNDVTRPVPNKLILPPMIEELLAAGVPREGIFILNATGTHRPNEGDEIIELIGEETASQYAFYNHNCFDDDMHRHVTTTASGTEVYLDIRYLDAEVKILTGLIEPHFMAGYSGGRKAICPGIASIKTVHRIHSPYFMEMRNAANCVVGENPLHQELKGIAEKAGVDFILNVVIDEDRKLCGVFCGHFNKAHRAGIDFAIQYDMVEADKKADIVVTSSAGYPLDKTYYQTIKGMVGALNVAKDGGTVIIASECSEGMGNDTFVECLKKYKEIGDIDKYIEYISNENNYTPDQWQVEKLLEALRKVNITLVTEGLSAVEKEFAGVDTAPTLDDALEKAIAEHGADAAVAVIPEGPYVIPCVACSDC
ncbi:MAG TPA: nickel-dependent lactate racemase [bacterium]|nr:nickel-dependent lactate racemase [bacterium]